MTAGSVTSGIDFALSTGGGIAGTVTAEQTGLPVASGFVEVFDDTGRFVDSESTRNRSSYAFAGLATVTLTASADAGSVFTGWSGGGCSGTGACVLTLVGDTTVSATFDAEVACAGVICLNANRFQLDVEWRTAEGGSGQAQAVPGVRSDDSAILYFFSVNNWEMLIKVLDGCRATNHYWVFAAATTNVGYTLRVTDTANGTVKEYVNPIGRASPAITDTSAFATCP